MKLAILLQEEFQKNNIKKTNETFARLLMIKADVELKLNNIVDSKKDILNALNILNEWYKDTTHRNQAYCHLVLGKIYDIEKQESNVVLTEYLSAEEIYKNTLNNLKLSEIAELYKNVATSYIKNNNIYFAKIYLNKLIDTFGITNLHVQELTKKYF